MSENNYRVLRRVLKHYDLFGWGIEFGVYSGTSLGLIAERMPVIGLDSFEGLPEKWRDGFDKGKFARKPPVPPFNSMLVRGWFDETLPWLTAAGMPTLGLVHIDCDLYSSTQVALEAVTPFVVDDTVIVFDEYRGYPGWVDHEAKAFTEWRERHNIAADEIDAQGEEVAFIIRKTP
jgi:hypothetical protein